MIKQNKEKSRQRGSYSFDPLSFLGISKGIVDDDGIYENIL